MGFAHYSLPNGDKEDFDDEKDFSLTKEELKQQSLIVKVINKKKVLDEPTCFNLDYSDERIDRYRNEDKSKYYLWFAVKDYTTAVKNFYCKLMQEFAKSNSNVELKEYIKENRVDNLIENCAEELKKAEQKLSQKINYSKCKTILDNKPIQELRKFGCKAWMIYFIQTQVKPGHKTFFDIAIDFEKDAKQMDLDNDFDVANLFSMQTKVEMYIKNHINKFNSPYGKLSKVDSTGGWLYNDLNPVQLFEEIVMEIKGYSAIVHKSTTVNAVKNITDKTALKLIDLYKDYGKIKLLIKKLKDLEDPTYLPDSLSLSEFRYYQTIEVKEENLYQLAIDYNKQSINLLSATPQNYRMYSDLTYFCTSLASLLESNRKFYTECEKIIERLNNEYEKKKQG